MKKLKKESSAEEETKTIKVIVKSDAKTDFVQFEGKQIGKKEAVEVSEKILKIERITQFIAII